MSIIPRKITKKQASDTGMAFTLILLIIGWITGNILFLKIAVPVLVINMVMPIFFYPFAFFWFGLSNLLGMIMSKLILTLVYFVVVVPVALIRKLVGKDTLKLKEYKKGKETVFTARNYKFSPGDIEKPF